MTHTPLSRWLKMHLLILITPFFSLRNNVSLNETIVIYADALYHIYLDPLLFPETVFLLLCILQLNGFNLVLIIRCISKSTESLKQQWLIFSSGFRKKNFLKLLTTYMHGNIDDTFIMFYSRSESRRFFHSINQLHPVLIFTCEFKHNCLPLLDVLVESTHLGFLTSI